MDKVDILFRSFKFYERQFLVRKFRGGGGPVGSSQVVTVRLPVSTDFTRSVNCWLISN